MPDRAQTPASAYLKEALRPAMPALEAIVREAMCDDIKCNTLRTDMLANRRIEPLLFNQMLTRFGLPHDDALQAFDGQYKLLFVLKFPRGDLIRTLGLAREARQLGQHHFNKSLDPSLGHLPREAIRDALAYVRFARSAPTLDPLTCAAVDEAGEAALAAWVWALPRNIRGRAAVASGVMCRESVPDACDATLATAVISDLWSAAQDNPA